MEDAVRQRINKVFAFYNTNVNQISEGNSALQVKLNRQLNQTSSISCQTIMFILCRFPNVSAEWLLRGDGNMVKADAVSNTYNIGNSGNSINTGANSSAYGADAELITRIIDQNNRLLTMLMNRPK